MPQALYLHSTPPPSGWYATQANDLPRSCFWRRSAYPLVLTSFPYSYLFVLRGTAHDTRTGSSRPFYHPSPPYHSLSELNAQVVHERFSCLSQQLGRPLSGTIDWANCKEAFYAALLSYFCSNSSSARLVEFLRTHRNQTYLLLHHLAMTRALHFCYWEAKFERLHRKCITFF
jgi:hypothetical protein